MGTKYVTMDQGVWHEMYHRGQKLSCCDCNLVHELDFRVKRQGTRNRLFMKVKRHERATAAKRRPFKFEKD
jgi:hypothetical protein